MPAKGSASGCWRSPARFSREDLLRAFDLLTPAETDIRGAAQPRYHLEMALLRWIHLRKLVPIEDLIAAAATAPCRAASRGAVRRGQCAGGAVAAPAARPPRQPRRCPRPRGRPSAADARAWAAPPPSQSGRRRRSAGSAVAATGRLRSRRTPRSRTRCWPRSARRKMVFYNTVVAQAQRIEVTPDRIVVHVLGGAARRLRDMFEQNRAWLETLAQQVSRPPHAGR